MARSTACTSYAVVTVNKLNRAEMNSCYLVVDRYIVESSTSTKLLTTTLVCYRVRDVAQIHEI